MAIRAEFGLVSILVGISVVLDCAAFALTYSAGFFDKNSEGNEIIHTLTFWYLVFVGVPFFVLLSISLPACICSCRKADSKNCCTPTYFVSVIVAGSLSVILTFVMGIVLMFPYYGDRLRLSPIFHGAAALFGVAMISATCSCLQWREGWQYCKGRSSYIDGTLVALTYITILLIITLIASILTVVLAPGTGNRYSNEGIRAIFFSWGTVICLFFGFCIGTPLICCSCCQQRYRMTVIRVVMCVWAILTAGTTVSGGLMILVGQAIPPEKFKKLIQAYFIGGLDIVTALVAAVLFCTGVLLPKFRNSAACMA